MNSGGNVNARTYGQVVGVVLLLLGVAGLLLGDQLIGLLNIEIVEDVIHLALGAVLAYIGFGMRDNGTARMIATVIGVTLLLVGVIGFVAPNLFGLLPKVGYTWLDHVVHLVLGALGVYVGRMGTSDRIGSRAA
ncbi:MAG: DUF4383 domain-containing protein [Candidatus Limnocylindria bacterium]